MSDTAQAGVKSAVEVVRRTAPQRASNGIQYACYGGDGLPGAEIERIVEVVPQPIAAALERRSYFFVPLVLRDWAADRPDEPVPGESGPEHVMIAVECSLDMSDRAICHRNAVIAQAEYTFLSVGLLPDSFALAFELYINIGHQFVDTVGIPDSFMNLVWPQAVAGIRGETSQDAWEYRATALGQSNWGPAEFRPNTPTGRSRRNRAMRTGSTPTPVPRRPTLDEKARTDYLRVAFADAIAIYLLSLAVDFDYSDLREREYPLLAAPALADRLRHVAEIFPPNSGAEFSIRHHDTA